MDGAGTCVGASLKDGGTQSCSHTTPFLPSIQVQAEYLTQLLQTPRPCHHHPSLTLHSAATLHFLPHTPLCSHTAFSASHPTLQLHCVPCNCVSCQSFHLWAFAHAVSQMQNLDVFYSAFQILQTSAPDSPADSLGIWL